ncbi:MAG: hypothetical protein WC728_09885 [Elusimicrobiota bacterium]
MTLHALALSFLYAAFASEAPRANAILEGDRAVFEDAQKQMDELFPLAEDLRRLQLGYPRYSSLDDIAPEHAGLRSRLEERVDALRAKHSVLRDIRQRQLYVSGIRVVGRAKTGRGQTPDQSLATLFDTDAEEKKVDAFLKEMKVLFARDDADYATLLARLEAERQKRLAARLGAAALALLAVGLCVWGFSGLRARTSG